MGKIRQLPPELANQIAAGEVVERPASVVKELVENAVDAGATRISILVEMGGKKLIRVEDDGEGMDPSDARLALERHATSKIARAEDLEAIRTMGFRGEALPSIASVSHFMLRTRRREAESGTEIRVNGGIVASVTEAGMAPGTIAEVGDLFYNLPARRKFLKSDVAETTQVSRMATQLALAYPAIGFTLMSGPRQLLRCTPASSLQDRFYQLYGERPDLVPVAKDAGGLRIRGYVAALADQGPTRGVQQYFVNGRIVKDRTIAHAVIDAYAAATARERSPEAHLFIEMPPDAVDVNVHPTKAEVRFRHQSLVHEVVRRAVQDAIGGGGAPELRLAPPAATEPGAVNVGLPSLLSGWQPAAAWGAQGQGAQVGMPALQPPPMAGLPGAAAAPGVFPAGSLAEIALKPLIPLGQFRSTFIIAVDDDGVAIIDQHVAHERVLYERISARLTAGALESQRLLTPIIMEMPPAACSALHSHGDQLRRCGFEVDEFGAGSVRIDAMPALLSREQGMAALKALAEDLEGLGGAAPVHEHLKNMAATMACHAAVKANDPLTHEKMAHILEELRLTAYSTVCPHGRPVMLRISRREVEKNFQRI
ncbi:MAG: DNA mismatch repair endonuclease MutL [Vicinamibacterales bacterium]|jgi:DNA mismatch repair protein MutL|nr:DNA mismatch repair endonuclease MutL [Vicinamibacterales bacterium]